MELQDNVKTVLPPLLADSLWGTDGPWRRSGELTPLYVCRYVGPHTGDVSSRHPFWELAYVSRGKGELLTTESHVLQTGSVSLIPPDTAHREYTPTRMEVTWIGLKGSRLKALSRQKVLLGRWPEVEPQVENLWLLSAHARGRVGPELDGLTAALLGRVLRLAEEEPQPTSRRIEQAAEWMHRHFSQPISMAETAERFGYSEGYFYRAFRRFMGQSPAAYLAAVRLQHAIQIMQHTTLTLERIARAVGYRDPLYFSRLFRKTHGCSPSAYRKTL